MRTALVVLCIVLVLPLGGAAFANDTFNQSRIGTLAFQTDDDAAHLANYRNNKWWGELFKLVGQASKRGEVIDIPPNTQIHVTEDRGDIFKGTIKGGSRELWFQAKDFAVPARQLSKVEVQP